MALLALLPLSLLAVSASPLPLEDASPAATDQTPPTYATRDDRIEGTISAIEGKYDIRVRDRKGYVDRVRLHDGTVIVPTGLRLTVGQSVTISGTNGGDRFEANEVDTPYDGADVGRFGFNVPPIGYPSYGSYGYGAFGGGYGYWNAAPFWPYGPAGWGPYGYGAFGAYGWPYGYSYGGGPYDVRPRRCAARLSPVDAPFRRAGAS